MTKQEAEKIVEAFGPCSVVYECQGPEGVMQLANICPVWLKVLLDCESIHAEQSGCYADWKAMKPGILQRLAALNYDVSGFI